MTRLVAVLLLLSIPYVTADCEMLKKSHYDVLTQAKTPELRICSGTNKCCTQETEIQIVEKAQRVFRSQLQDRVIILRHMLHSNLNSFRTYFYTSLNTCHNNLDTMFRNTYGPFYESNTKVFDAFFNRLRAFSSPYSDASVPVITKQLFSQLFRVVFSLLNPLHRVSESQWKCMESNMDEIEPFGDVPQKVTAHLEKALTNWRHFVAALESAHEVLEGFMNASLSKECVSNLARMGDCSMCSVEQPVKPCSGFCQNVLKGCLAEWAEIDQQWNSVIGSLVRMTHLLRGPHNLQNVFHPLPVQLSEAVMIFQERGATVTNKVLARCFHMESDTNSNLVRGKRAIWLRSVRQQAEGNWKVLHQLMSTFGDRLDSLKGWFRTLPESICADDGISAKSNEQCWNGSDVSAYIRKVASDGVSQQNSNPEYQKNRHLSYRGVFVDERLRLGMISFRLHNVLYGRNYSNYEVEGSSEISDDEDYAEGSGDISIVNLEQDRDSTVPKVQVLPQSRSSSFVPFSTVFVFLLWRLTRLW